MSDLPMCVGIDLSLTGTAVCWGREPGKHTVRKMKSVPQGKGIHNRIRRMEGLVGRLNDLVTSLRPDAVLLEGYSFGSSTNGKWLAELGGIARFHFVEYCAHLYEVPPTNLKLYVAGHGHADKKMMMDGCLERWGVKFTDDDEADAYGLWRMMLEVCGTVSDSRGRYAEQLTRVVPNGRIEIAARPEPAGAAAF